MLLATCVLLTLFLCDVQTLELASTDAEKLSVDDARSTVTESGQSTEVLFERLRVEHRDHTLADIDSYRTLDMFLSLTVDMEKEILSGFVETTLVKLRTSNNNYESLNLVLDVGQFVVVSRVEEAVSGEEVSHEMKCRGEEYNGVMKCVLVIEEMMRGVGELKIRIYYSVSGSTSALHFIPTHQTHDGKEKFLVSVTQPSNARGWIPCQDTPALKFPYRAEIAVKARFTALMSGLQDGPGTKQEGGWVKTSFTQSLPIPPYLIALTVADMDYIDVQESENEVPIRVWTERSISERIKSSGILSVIPKMMEICERKLGPYAWGRYDVVLTPPGYIFGGMEYPSMNYISTTNIDIENLSRRPNYEFSQITAHEMIHSWFGNIVTPKYAKDAWLAEGITVFMELQLMEEIYGKDIGMLIRKRKFLDLKKAIVSYGDNYRVLNPYLYEEHPFNGLNYVVYNKGALFMEFLANYTSRSETEEMLRGYIDTFYYKSVDTDDFLHSLFQTMPKSKSIKDEIIVWLEFPETDFLIDLFPSTLYDDCTVLYQVFTRRKSRKAGFNLQDVAEVYLHGNGSQSHLASSIHMQTVVVLQRLGQEVGKSNKTNTKLMKSWKILVNRLDRNFGFSKLYKSDPFTFTAWEKLALAVNHAATEKVLLEFLERFGRVEMLYTTLAASEDKEMRAEMAKVLLTKHDINVYPSFIGQAFKVYLNLFLDEF